VLPLRRFAAFALLTLWVPALLHCRLEAAGMLFAEDCCESSSRSHAATKAPTGCVDDACETAEGEFTKPTANDVGVTAPVLLPALVWDLLVATTLFDGPPCGVIAPTSTAPPEIRRTWTFVTRAAPTPRAPSALA
jgi:hypothetical protein